MLSLGPAGLAIVAFIGAVSTLSGVFAVSQIMCRLTAKSAGECLAGRRR